MEKETAFGTDFGRGINVAYQHQYFNTLMQLWRQRRSEDIVLVPCRSGRCVPSVGQAHRTSQSYATNWVRPTPHGDVGIFSGLQLCTLSLAADHRTIQPRVVDREARAS
jgi:hypothetical protein